MSFLSSITGKVKDVAEDVGHETGKVGKDIVKEVPKVGKEGLSVASGILGGDQQQQQAQLQAQQQAQMEAQQQAQLQAQQQAPIQAQQQAQMQEQNATNLNYETPDSQASYMGSPQQPMGQAQTDDEQAIPLVQNQSIPQGQQGPPSYEQLAETHRQRSIQVGNRIPEMIASYQQGQFDPRLIQQASNQVFADQQASHHYMSAGAYQKSS